MKNQKKFSTLNPCFLTKLHMLISLLYIKMQTVALHFKYSSKLRYIMFLKVIKKKIGKVPYSPVTAAGTLASHHLVNHLKDNWITARSHSSAVSVSQTPVGRWIVQFLPNWYDCTIWVLKAKINRIGKFPMARDSVEEWRRSSTWLKRTSEF